MNAKMYGWRAFFSVSIAKVQMPAQMARKLWWERINHRNWRKQCARRYYHIQVECDTEGKGQFDEMTFQLRFCAWLIRSKSYLFHSSKDSQAPDGFIHLNMCYYLYFIRNKITRETFIYENLWICVIEIKTMNQTEIKQKKTDGKWKNNKILIHFVRFIKSRKCFIFRNYMQNELFWFRKRKLSNDEEEKKIWHKLK